MVAPSSNIYISATQPHPRRAGGESDNGNPQPTPCIWMISVEPHKSHMPFMPKHKIEPVHYYASREGEEDVYQLHTHGTDGIIGTILIAEGAHGDAEQVLQALQAGLNSTSAAQSSGQALHGEGERWIRSVLQTLQTHKFTDAFDIGELMTFAKDYFAKRLDGSGLARTAYPGLHENHREKSSKHHLWLTYPTKSPRIGDQESRIYGGLM
ncbi:hypothetical protein LTR91_013391 [Friedmanniomyces endolithicus]|uniref:Uncharacterized protein n=2 Tax=Friedmanniomyces endolithicus TaxID=329885 RepID=A0AAN6KDN5_9PEZI|nr:hypothetical protein LTS09_015393 [Friedmanniomyces endolithicus]KAK0268113.1 hypothetical protein LTR35_015783 [Friedmanniomyces endolithicus]KAK0275829.1 hypothetical protein LTS00_014862 [Friedmanniomyces endolithicus]KAK0311892.1 hypothetical protein LTR01_002806 [Friedmanniomyces endolithicus]KAK0832125.1 hypothetical protein LTR73_002412 [Friedmanniomyces endolithicus]